MWHDSALPTDGASFMTAITDYDVVIIGAGAAGLMCAIEAGKRGRRVIVLDKARKLAPKILISGGGRCNFTNLHVEPEAYRSANPHFCKSALARYTQWDFIALMDKHGLGWQEKSLGQLFCDEKSPAVVAMLENECIEQGVEIKLNCEITAVEHGEGFNALSETGDYSAEALVIATGGPSIPRMGSTDFGVRMARQFGIRSIPFQPALVPFTFAQADIDRYFKDLSGIAIDTIISCNGASFRESLLITHRGLSGPACLQISSYWNKGDHIEINLLPEIDAVAWLLELRQTRGKANLKTILAEHFPKRLAARLADTLLETPYAYTPMGEIRIDELKALAEHLNRWVLNPAGTEGMRTAEVSLGGVDTNELSSKTMQANKVPDLYFIGETVDVTGWLGGYNFQWAWASGWVAGQVV
jgi:predicted Rossmann fold flavoprotein